MSTLIRIFVSFGYSLIAAACVSAPSSASVSGPLPAAARIMEVRAKFQHHATIAGNDVSFSRREDQGSKIILKDCVVVLPKGGITAASDECVVERGQFTFKGTPVVRQGSNYLLGHAETVIVLAPLADGGYSIHTTGLSTTTLSQ